MFQNLSVRLGRLLRAWSAPNFVSFGHLSRADWTVTFSCHHGIIKIGDGTRVLRGSEFLAPVTLGKDCWVNRDAYFRPNTTLGDRVNVGPFVRFVTDHHAISNTKRRAGEVSYVPIYVGDGAWIGAGAIILGGVSIGSGALVAAGAVVHSDVAPNALVAGVPARLIKMLDPLED